MCVEWAELSRKCGTLPVTAGSGKRKPSCRSSVKRNCQGPEVPIHIQMAAEHLLRGHR
jgi:hypothetical protein